jgi:hypothetical protein
VPATPVAQHRNLAGVTPLELAEEIRAAADEQACAGSVALSVGMIEAGLSSEVVEPLSAVVTSEVGVRRVPVPA